MEMESVGSLKSPSVLVVLGYCFSLPAEKKTFGRDFYTHRVHHNDICLCISSALSFLFKPISVGMGDIGEESIRAISHLPIHSVMLVLCVFTSMPVYTDIMSLSLAD